MSKSTPDPKTAAKSGQAKKTLAKKPVTKATKLTLKELHSSISKLETRMKRASTLTRKSVTALETAVTALDNRTQEKIVSDNLILSHKVSQLSDKLTHMVEQTQRSVNSELKTALANPSIENLKAAVTRADQRLTQSETAQADAITKINRHLASIATAVDARLAKVDGNVARMEGRIAQEETSRSQAIAALKAETSKKIEITEQDTATAINTIGDKIVELSDEIKRRSEAYERSLRDKVSELAQQTQTKLDDYKETVETEIENVSKKAIPVDNGETRKLEHKVFSLTNRLEELENNFTNLSSQNAAPRRPNSAPRAPQIKTGSAGPNIKGNQTPPKLSVIATPPMNATKQDAFTPPAQKTRENPYTNSQPDHSQTAQAAPQTPPPENHAPQEFRSINYTHMPTQNSAQSQYMPEPMPAMPVTPPPPAPSIPPALQNIMPAPVTGTTQPLDPLPPLDLTAQPYSEDLAPHQPYSNPAYAENEKNGDDIMADIRIGGSPVKSFTPPKFTGRNLRVAALATGVAVIGLVAAKGVLGNNDKGIQSAQLTQDKYATPSATQVGAPVVVEPIGNYADNKAPRVTGEAANNLNSAASAGDPIAQFQLGLSYLEQGRTNEGVDLIRKSANQNQPAAQYRLAKLYEVGEGVSQDSSLARQLTERAARNGNRIAMHDLALYYAEGRGGIKAELPTAANWFKKAAERGVVDSQFNLGVLYESGQGLPKSMTDAFVWYSIAAAQGDQFAKKRIDVLSDSMSPADVARAKTRIVEFNPVKIDETANGIFRNVAWAKSDTSSTQRVSQVKEVQSLLSELGYDIGGADGSIGPRTRSAIISFEKANSLPETGRVNSALLDRLELAAGV